MGKKKGKKKEGKDKSKKGKKKGKDKSKKKGKSSSSSSSSSDAQKKKSKKEKEPLETAEELDAKNTWIRERLDVLRQMKPPMPMERCLVRAQKEWIEHKKRVADEKAQNLGKDWPPMVHEAM